MLRFLLLLLIAGCADGADKQAAINPTPAVNAAPDDLAAASNIFCQVEKIFESSCIGCHTEQGKPALVKGLASSALINKVNAQGNYLVKVGNAAESELYKRVSSHDPDYRMPKNAGPLSSTDIETIKTWIDSGAPTRCL